jgi:prevent-host-death family protein
MAKHPETIPLSDFRQNSAKALKAVRESDQPLYITDQGRGAAVMLSIEVYEWAEHERQLLLQLARGEKEIAEGTGHNLDSVLAVADALLADEPL